MEPALRNAGTPTLVSVSEQELACAKPSAHGAEILAMETARCFVRGGRVTQLEEATGARILVAESPAELVYEDLSTTLVLPITIGAHRVEWRSVGKPWLVVFNRVNASEWLREGSSHGPIDGATRRERRVLDRAYADIALGRLWECPRDEATARDAISFAYMMADLDPPGVSFADGPCAAAELAKERGLSVLFDGLAPKDDHLESCFWMLDRMKRTRVTESFAEDFDRSDGTAIPGAMLTTTVLRDVAARVGYAETGRSLLDRGLEGSIATLCFARFLAETSLLPDAAMWEGMWRMLRACGVAWWANESEVVVSRAPVAIARDSAGRLHGEEGAAIAWANGDAVFAWHGVTIPEAMLHEKHACTAERIRGEPNVERRRILMEMYGMSRYAKELGATIVAEDGFGKLWRCEIEGEAEALVLVEVENATPEPDGTKKKYFLRVPPTMRTARMAVAWTFGLTEDAYCPDVES